MVKKIVSIAVSLAVAANFALPVYAANLVAIPQNVRPPIFTPAPVQTRSTELSFEAVESKISDVFKPEKENAKLQATYSGTCGDNVKWNLNTSTGVLTISGTGAMTDYAFKDSIFYSYKDNFKTVTIENGVYSIGNYAFAYCDKFTSVTIPTSVASIGQGAFEASSSLIAIAIPNSVNTIGSWAFSCTGLTKVTIPDSVASIGYDAFSSTGLTEVIYNGTSNPSTTSVFWGCNRLRCILVPTAYTSNTFGTHSVVKGNTCPAPTPTASRSPMATPSRSPMATRSRSPSKSPMATRSRSPMATRSRSPMATRSRSPMATPTPTPTTKFTMSVNYFHKKPDAVFVYPMLYYALALE